MAKYARVESVTVSPSVSGTVAKVPIVSAPVSDGLANCPKSGFFNNCFGERIEASGDKYVEMESVPTIRSGALISTVFSIRPYVMAKDKYGITNTLIPDIVVYSTGKGRESAPIEAIETQGREYILSTSEGKDGKVYLNFNDTSNRTFEFRPPATEVVFGESLSIVGLIKGYINGINGFDDVVAESREVFANLEPALNDALSSGNIARDDPMMVTFETIHTALVEYRRTIEKIGNNEVSCIKEKKPDINDTQIKKEILQLIVQRNKFDYNKKLLEKIKDKKFSENDFLELGKEKINFLTLNSIKDNKKFEINSVEILYSLPIKTFTLISDEKDKIYLAQIKNFIDVNLDKNTENYKLFINKENTRIRSSILKSYDLLLNEKYDVNINQVALSNFKNLFQ